MNDESYVLGIDSSTQSTTAIILDRETFTTVAEAKVKYREDPRLSHLGLGSGAPILFPIEKGEASQPVELFLEALDAIFSDLPQEALSRLAAINLSAQQHGQVWVGESGCKAIAALRREGSGLALSRSLADQVCPGLAYDRAPIWMSSNAQPEADAIRKELGGAEAVTSRSGSDSPARFSGAVLARTAKLSSDSYKKTYRIHLISSFLAAILSGNPDAPIDWGNGSGTSLMNWESRSWDPILIAAAANAGKIRGGTKGLKSRLPEIAHPLSKTGTIAAYFTERYGIPPECFIIASSGDNPQTKVLASGALLSLGTSFVIMGEGTRPLVSANAMYDGLGRPFLFGCRTNGSLTLESIRAHYGDADDFGRAEQSLATVEPGTIMRLLQSTSESFPCSPALDIGKTGQFDTDYAGCVDSTLGLVALASREFTGHGDVIAVTGGATASIGILKRIAAIWRKPVLPIANAGAAAGAAVAAICALAPESERDALAQRARGLAANPGPLIHPSPISLQAYHAEGGYLNQLARIFAKATGIQLTRD